MTSNPLPQVLSVIMPVYNGTATVADVIRKVLGKVLEQPQVAELIVVDGGS
jgi:glycosyltransferase involved in cell wall biosynthesis